MKFLIGYYETELIQNTIDTPKSWHEGIGTHTLYCSIELYRTKTGKTLKRIHCCLEQNSRDFKCLDGNDTFTLHVDRRKRVHIPLKYMKECEFVNDNVILIFGMGHSFYIQSEREEISKEAILKFEEVLSEFGGNKV